MNRREFVRTVCIGAATVGLAGCTGPSGGSDGTPDGASGANADVSVTIVRNAPENPGPLEDPVGTVTTQESEELVVDGFIFQRGGEKGLVVAGDATNAGDRPLQDLGVEVTLNDTNETEDRLFDSASQQTSRGRLDTGETWQWAATFDEDPEFEIDYYVVRATADYA